MRQPEIGENLWNTPSFNPAQVTIKNFTSRETMGIMQPKIWTRLPGSRDPHYFRSNYFWIPDAHFYSISQRNRIYITKHRLHTNFIHCTPLQLFFRGYFCSYVENVISVRDPFFLHIKSGCRYPLLKIHHPMSYLSKKHVAVQITFAVCCTTFFFAVFVTWFGVQSTQKQRSALKSK